MGVLFAGQVCRFGRRTGIWLGRRGQRLNGERLSRCGGRAFYPFAITYVPLFAMVVDARRPISGWVNHHVERFFFAEVHDNLRAAATSFF